MSRSRPTGEEIRSCRRCLIREEAVGDGVSQIQMTARHPRSHFDIALACSDEIAGKALATKAAMFWDFGMTARLCGNALQRQVSTARPRVRLVGESGRAICSSSSLATALQSIEPLVAISLRASRARFSEVRSSDAPHWRLRSRGQRRRSTGYCAASGAGGRMPRSR